MKLKKTKFKPIWLIAPALVATWLLVMFFINGVYPFGEGTIIGYDLQHGGVPNMCFVYDAWHSGDFARLFYDFNSAGGFAHDCVLSLFQPQNLFLFFWDRDNLANAVSVLFLVKLVVIAFTSSYAFSEIFPKLKASWLTVVSVMYTFCGFNLLYFTNIDWLDTVALYPLLIVFALNMFKGNSKLPFFFVLTYLMAFATYMSFFVVISLVVFGGLYIFIIEDKANRKKSIYNLGVGTGAGLLSSSYFIFLYAKNIFSTARFDEGSYVLDGYTGKQEKLSGYLGILDSANEIDIVSVFMFLGMSLAIASLIVMWVHFKKHKDSRKYTIFFTITIVLFVLQIIFKSVMLVWHLGSYQKFPFRNGYMVAFFCCCIVAYYFSRFGSLEGVRTKLSVVNFFTFIPAFFAAIAIASYSDVFIFAITNTFMVLNDYIKFQTGTMAYPYACLAIASIVCFLFIKLISFEKLRKVLTIVLVIVLLGINTFGLVAECSYPGENGLYKEEYDLKENFEQKDVLSRVVNNDGILMINYPYISGVSAISNWTHSLPGNHLKAFSDLGFCSYFTYVYDMGGTVFSRALLRVTDTVSESKLNKNLYTQYKETELGMKYYSNNYNLPVGVTFDETIKTISADDCSNLFEYQNDIYKASGGKGDLFERVEYSSIKEKIKKETIYVNKEKEDGSGKGVFLEDVKRTTTTFTFDVHEKSVLYLFKNNKDVDLAFAEISVNGEKVHIYDGKSVIDSSASFNTKYPNSINTGILELGVFENETVTVRIKFNAKAKTKESVALYIMDLNKMSQLCEAEGNNEYSVDNGTITFNTKGKDGDIAFVPISYDRNWKCTVNGKVVEPVCVLGNFMGVEIDEGKNNVVMDFSTEQICFKYALRAFFFVLGLIVVLIEKKIKMPKQIYNLTFVAFAAIFIGCMVAIYVLPVGWSVVKSIVGLISGVGL